MLPLSKTTTIFFVAGSSCTIFGIFSFAIIKRINKKKKESKNVDNSNNKYKLWKLVGDSPELVPIFDNSHNNKDGTNNNNNSSPPKMLTSFTRSRTSGSPPNKDKEGNSSDSSEERAKTAVLIHGFGCTSLEWQVEDGLTQQLLSRGINVFAYDRILFYEEGSNNNKKNNGGKGEELQSRNAFNLVEELRTLLKLKKEELLSPPYILIGHSAGGLVAQCYAMLYPEEVDGLILIDPAHEDQFKKLPKDFSFGFVYITPCMFSLYDKLARSWMTRNWFFHFLDYFSLFNFPPLFLLPKNSPIRRAAIDLYSGVADPSSSKSVWSLVAKELEGCIETFERMKEFREEHDHLPPRNIPSALIIAGNRQFSPTLYPKAITEAFINMHKDFCEQMDAPLFLANDSDHWIHIQQPQIVADAIDYILLQQNLKKTHHQNKFE